MNDYVITCSTTCDLNKEHLEKNNNPYVHFSFYINDKKYLDDFYSEVKKDEFYNLIRDNDSKTSQPDPEEYVKVFSSILDQGKDVLHVELSSGISGAFNSANIAKDMIKDNYKDRKIYIVDSLSASSGFGLFVDILNKLKNDGKSIDEVYDFAINNRININCIFYTNDLSQLIKGGRVSKTAGAIGKLLNIIPIMHVNKDGKLEVIEKIRGRNNALKFVVDTIKKNYKGEYIKGFYVANSNCEDLATEAVNKIKENFTDLKDDDIKIFDIGTVIGTHTGKGTVAIFYYGGVRQ